MGSYHPQRGSLFLEFTQYKNDSIVDNDYIHHRENISHYEEDNWDLTNKLAVRLAKGGKYKQEEVESMLQKVKILDKKKEDHSKHGI